VIQVDRRRAPRDLLPKIARLFALSGAKIRSIEETWRAEDGAPVCTVEGAYRARGWTEWTGGFQFGSALLQFDATGETEFLELGRSRTIERMAPHLTRPLRFVLPQEPGMRPAWMLRFGLFVYDHLGGRRILPATVSLTRRLKSKSRSGFWGKRLPVRDWP